MRPDEQVEESALEPRDLHRLRGRLSLRAAGPESRGACLMMRGRSEQAVAVIFTVLLLGMFTLGAGVGYLLGGPLA